MTTTTNDITPLDSSGRQASIDLLRGIAVFGILLVNIEAWALPEILRMNPFALGAAAGDDLIVWYLIRGFAEYKFVGLFSLLFGAGVAMQWQRVQAQGGVSGRLHYRRMLWLGLFGILHGVLFWTGEILLLYALWGLVMLPIVKAGERIQKRCLIAFFALLLLGIAIVVIGVQVMPDDMRAEAQQEWILSDSALQEKIDFALQPLYMQWLERAQEVALAPVILLLSSFSWKAGAMMVLGVLLYNRGILSARKDSAYYRKMAVGGIGLGMVILLPGLYYGHDHHWAFLATAGMRDVFLQISSVPLLLGYLALVMLWHKHGMAARLREKMQAVGRMSLSNYLLHTLIGTFIFYGYGLGLYHQIDRLGQMAIVLAIWLIQLYGSAYWLRYFRYGPFEWLWRSLTYAHPQRLKI